MFLSVGGIVGSRIPPTTLLSSLPHLSDRHWPWPLLEMPLSHKYRRWCTQSSEFWIEGLVCFHIFSDPESYSLDTFLRASQLLGGAMVMVHFSDLFRAQGSLLGIPEIQWFLILRWNPQNIEGLRTGAWVHFHVGLPR